MLDVFSRCHQKVNCKVAWGGKIWGCGYTASATLLGGITDNPNDYVDLSSDVTIEGMRNAVRKLGSHPFEGCKYCKGHDPNETERYPAAEQLTSRV
jgi:hypothetical protein